MGYWGGNNDDGENELIEQQIEQNNAQIEEQRQALSERRLQVIKSQGAPDWSPQPPPKPPKQAPANFEQSRRRMFGGGE